MLNLFQHLIILVLNYYENLMQVQVDENFHFLVIPVETGIQTLRFELQHAYYGFLPMQE